MQQLDQLVSTLKQIDDVADKIIRKTIPIIKIIASDKNKYVAILKLKHPATEDKDLVDMLLSASGKLAKDAKSVKTEINDFIEYTLLTGEESQTPYFSEVWQGDVYGTTKVAALKDLLTDLTDQLKNCSLENMLKGL